MVDSKADAILTYFSLCHESEEFRPSMHDVFFETENEQGMHIFMSRNEKKCQGPRSVAA